MKRTFRLLILITLAAPFLFKNGLMAQSLEETLSSLSSTVGKAYVAPVISAFGSNLNSGWVSKLPAPTKVGLHLDFKIIGMGSFFSNDNKTFSANGNFYFTENQANQLLTNSGITTNIGSQNYADLKYKITHTPFNVGFSGPTVVGKGDEHLKVDFPANKITLDNGQEYNVDSYNFEIEEVNGYLKDLSILPTAAIQITGGTVAGTNVSFRFLPSVEIEDLGKFTFWGLGAIHNPAVWFDNPIPLDFGIGYFYQKLTVGDIFETNASQFGLYAGKTFGFIIAISPYVGITFESSKTTVKYDYQSNEVDNGVQVPPVRISFDSEGENSTGFVVGFNLKLSVVNINADYKVAKTKTASAGISFGF